MKYRIPGVCILSLVVGICAVAWAQSATPAPDEPIGRVTAAFGVAAIQTPTGERSGDLHALIKSGDRIHTNGGGVTVLLASRVVLKIDHDTSVMVNESPDQLNIVLERGTVHVYVGHRPLSAGPVCVQDPHARVETENGVFLANYDPKTRSGYYACEHSTISVDPSSGRADGDKGDGTASVGPILLPADKQLLVSDGIAQEVEDTDRVAFNNRKQSLERLGQVVKDHGTDTFRMRTRLYDTQLAINQLAEAGWIDPRTLQASQQQQASKKAAKKKSSNTATNEESTESTDSSSESSPDTNQNEPKQPEPVAEEPVAQGDAPAKDKAVKEPANEAEVVVDVPVRTEVVASGSDSSNAPPNTPAAVSHISQANTNNSGSSKPKDPPAVVRLDITSEPPRSSQAPPVDVNLPDTAAPPAQAMVETNSAPPPVRLDLNDNSGPGKSSDKPASDIANLDVATPDKVVQLGEVRPDTAPKIDKIDVVKPDKATKIEKLDIVRPDKALQIDKIDRDLTSGSGASMPKIDLDVKTTNAVPKLETTIVPKLDAPIVPKLDAPVGNVVESSIPKNDVKIDLPAAEQLPPTKVDLGAPPKVDLGVPKGGTDVAVPAVKVPTEIAAPPKIDIDVAPPPAISLPKVDLGLNQTTSTTPPSDVPVAPELPPTTPPPTKIDLNLSVPTTDLPTAPTGTALPTAIDPNLPTIDVPAVEAPTGTATPLPTNETTVAPLPTNDAVVAPLPTPTDVGVPPPTDTTTIDATTVVNQVTQEQTTATTSTKKKRR